MISAKDLLNIALKVESTGYVYYKNLAERVSGDVKKLFENLADQERDHSRRFQEILGKYGESFEVSLEVLGYLEALAETSIFPKLSERPPEDLGEAVKLAIEVEKDSILFYTELLSYVPEKRVIEEIVEEEKRHLRSLLNLRF